MFDELAVPYKVLLPSWVFKNAKTEHEIEENAKRYIEKSFPEREFIAVEGEYALCKSKNVKVR